MSVINKVLQDLEKRRASGAERAVMSKHVRALPREDRSWTIWWIASLAAVAIVVAGAGAWYIKRPQPPAQALQTVPPEIAAQAPALALAREETRTDTSPPLSGPIPTSALIAARPAAEPTLSAREPELRKAREPPEERAPLNSPPDPARATARALPTTAPEHAPRTPAPELSAAKATATGGAPHIDKRAQQPSAAQLAETDYRDGTSLLHQGRLAEAQEKFRSALHHTPGHAGARQGLFGLLLDAKRAGEAEQVLSEGLAMNSAQPGLAMALARMQVDRGETAGAIETLHKSSSSALGRPDYIAFYAALLQRQGRHSEAVEQYQTALSLAPGAAIWSMGLGISLQALNRTQEARDAFRRAFAAKSLSPDLQAFVDQRLKQLQ